MVPRKIVWSATAKIQLFEILNYFIERNKSNSYSIKLYNAIKTQISLLINQPFVGKKTNEINVRGLIQDHYIIFYEVKETTIIILTVWDTRQNPKKIKF